MSRPKRALTGAQIRAARSLIKWTAEDLAVRSSVSLRTIRRAELADQGTSQTNTTVDEPSGQHWKPAASNSSMRMAGGPACAFGSSNGKKPNGHGAPGFVEEAASLRHSHQLKHATVRIAGKYLQS